MEYYNENPDGGHDDYPVGSHGHGINFFVIFLILILLLLGSSGYRSFY